jgi:hypothetical protein
LFEADYVPISWSYSILEIEITFISAFGKRISDFIKEYLKESWKIVCSR